MVVTSERSPTSVVGFRRIHAVVMAFSLAISLLSIRDGSSWGATLCIVRTTATRRALKRTSSSANRLRLAIRRERRGLANSTSGQ